MMKSILLAGAAALALSTAAQADCLDRSADTTRIDSLNQRSAAAQPNAGISKDGTHAPLETRSGSAGSGVTAGTAADASGASSTGSGSMPATGSMADSASGASGANPLPRATGSGSTSGSGSMTGPGGPDRTASVTDNDRAPGSSASTTGSGTTGSGTTGSGMAGSGASGSSTMAAGSGQPGGSAQDGVAKNGQTMPLAQNQGGGDANRAMSGQDVMAQQQGDRTAAAKAGQGDC